MERQVRPEASVTEGDEDWELCNDDGFVYKRRRMSSSVKDAGAGETSKPPDRKLDHVEEERNRKIRKKRILLKLKRKYQREIDQWEILSNSLNTMKEKIDRFQTQQREENANETTSFSESSFTEYAGEDASKPPSMIDEFLFMTDAQEAIIHEISNMCEVVENVCKVEEEEEEEEKVKQPLFDLAIWSSPMDLMASLCAD